MSAGGAEAEHGAGHGGVIERITDWLVRTATAQDIRRLPALLRRARLQRVAERLQRKLQRVEAQLEGHL